MEPTQQPQTHDAFEWAHTCWIRTSNSLRAAFVGAMWWSWYFCHAFPPDIAAEADSDHLMAHGTLIHGLHSNDTRSDVWTLENFVQMMGVVFRSAAPSRQSAK